MGWLGKANSSSHFSSPQVVLLVLCRCECDWPAAESRHHTNYVLNILEHDWLVAFCFKKKSNPRDSEGCAVQAARCSEWMEEKRCVSLRT